MGPWRGCVGFGGGGGGAGRGKGRRCGRHSTHMRRGASQRRCTSCGIADPGFGGGGGAEFRLGGCGGTPPRHLRSWAIVGGVFFSSEKTRESQLRRSRERGNVQRKGDTPAVQEGGERCPGIHGPGHTESTAAAATRPIGAHTLWGGGHPTPPPSPWGMLRGPLGGGGRGPGGMPRG